MQMPHLPLFRQLLEHEIAIVKSPIIYCDKNAIIKICRLIIFQICLSRCNYKKAQTQSSFIPRVKNHSVLFILRPVLTISYMYMTFINVKYSH